jgi:16S rRNA (cytosine1402-N4)-methyltransferase
MKNTPQQLHLPVLLSETLEVLAPKAAESYRDLTAGYGGHAREVLARTGAPEKAVLVDRDKNAIRELKNQCGLANAELVQKDFLTAVRNLHASGSKFDLILMDLGVSSAQLDEAVRGFSFRHDAALDMRMDESQKRTAADVVNKTPEKELARILVRYGEEGVKTARKIAHQICLNRPVTSTGQLAKIVAEVSPRRGKTHPATRTFQAIRIETNDELGQLQAALPLAVELLNPGGRLAVISFHSLEDRIVKEYFKEENDAGYEAKIHLVNKKPIVAGKNELVYNPRARSAKLRAVAKQK